MTIEELTSLKEEIVVLEKTHQKAETYREFAGIIDGADVITISMGADSIRLGFDNSEFDYEIISGIVDLLKTTANEVDKTLTNLRVTEGLEE